MTYLDACPAERTELSATSVENAAAKIANALRDEFDLDVGSTVGLALPLHWQRSTWCAGVWTAGCVVVLGEAVADADLVVAGPAEAAAAGRPRPPATSWSSPCTPSACRTPIRCPPGTSDVTLAVRQQPDAYLFDPPSGGPRRPARRRCRAPDARTRSSTWRAERPGTGASAAVAGCSSTTGPAPLDAWLGALAVPLAMGASVAPRAR